MARELKKIISIPNHRIRGRHWEARGLEAVDEGMAVKRQKTEADLAKEYAWLQNPRMEIVVENTRRLWTTLFLFYNGLVVSPSSNFAIGISDLNTGEILKKLEGHTELIGCLARHGDMLASGSDDGTVRLWDLRTGTPIKTLVGHGHFEGDPKACDHRIDAVALNDRFVVSSCTDDYSTRVWEISTGRCRHVFRGETSRAHGMVFRGRYVVLGHVPARLVDLETGGEIRRFEVPNHVFMRSAVFHQGNLLTGHSDGTIRVWNPDAGECLRVMEGHKQLVYCLLPYQDIVFSGSWDTSIKIWHIPTGQCLQTLGVPINATPEEWKLVSTNKGHTHHVNDLFIENHALVSGSTDLSIRRWVFGHPL